MAKHKGHQIAVYNSGALTLTDGQETGLFVDVNGYLLATLVASDIEIGAVEIKNSTDDTRATVGANGLYVDVRNQVAPTTVLNGRKNVTTAGTKVTLAASTVCQSVTIKALPTNTGIIYVGDATVSSANGFVLYPGDTTSMDLANLATVNLDSSVSGEGVAFLGVA